ncbi:MAG: hypothetical protein QNJ69_09550 [Gammaproteobacteria bacterium]|nr:hypothetical protein [Gammaproteobacteria bacterium]
MAVKNSNTPVLLSILELGGYPDFSKLYQSLGYQVYIMESMRKALKFIKNNRVDVIVAEFNFQSDFRDRSSQLESLMASIAQKPGVDVVVFYDKEQQHQFQRVAQRFQFIGSLPYPIDESELAAVISQRTATAV